MNRTPPLLGDFLDYLRAIRGVAESTRREYKYDLLLLLRFLVGRKQNIDISDEVDVDLSVCDEAFHRSIELRDLYAFLGWLDTERDNASASRARRISSMRSYFHFLTDKLNVLSVDPTSRLETPKRKQRYPVYLTLDESKRLLSQIQRTKNDLFRSRDYAIVLLFLTSGVRLSELAGINLTDLDQESLRVVGKGNKERTVYLSPAVKEAIQEYLSYRPVVKNESALFLSTQKRRMSHRTIQTRIEKHLREAGFDTKLYSTHKLRHTAATLMYKHGGVDIRALQQVLGHESVATTQIYTHTDEEQLRSAIEKNPLAHHSVDGSDIEKQP